MHGASLINIQNFMTLTIWASNDGVLGLIQYIHNPDNDREIFQNEDSLA
jgi:hypothetical protein